MLKISGASARNTNCAVEQDTGEKRYLIKTFPQLQKKDGKQRTEGRQQEGKEAEVRLEIHRLPCSTLLNDSSPGRASRGEVSSKSQENKNSRAAEELAQRIALQRA